MHDDLQATIESLVEEYDRQVREVHEVHARLGEVTATVSDGNVTITAGPQGRIDEIVFHPRVYGRLSPTELARAVQEQIAKAQAEVDERSHEIMAPLMPEGLDAGELSGGLLDLGALLPDPPAAGRSGEGRHGVGRRGDGQGEGRGGEGRR
ncbi:MULTISPECIES: YbaB/EbfC family nucleoid-associated protein [unclassified Nonomuraea]|uniref:YbaB/EbfC family nucleoid-associated protein n=1 Tax=unclassified Nonomuraea TaxID=2593643 RepID=UPI0033C7CFB5